MHEYDVNERKEAPASLPPKQHDSSNTILTNRSSFKSLQVQVNLHRDKSLTGANIEDRIGTAAAAAVSRVPNLSPKCLTLYPLVVQLVDKAVAPQAPQATQASQAIAETEPNASPKRKRQRRIYAADPTRCSSLRSRQEPAIIDLTEGATSKQPPSPPPAQAASPTPTEPTEYIHPGTNISLLRGLSDYITTPP